MRDRMTKKDYPIVEVLWVDAEEKGDVGWNDLKEMIKYAKRPCPTMKSVGYVLHRTDEHIALLSTIGPEECSTVEKIPMSFVKEVREIVTKTKVSPSKTSQGPGNKTGGK